MAILIDASASFNVSNDVISRDSLGIEFLGIHGGSAFVAMDDYFDPSHLRWPGGLYVENAEGYNRTFASLAYDYTAPFQRGAGNYRYDLKSPDFVNWDKGNGRSREGLDWFSSFIAGNAGGAVTSLAIMTPTANYAVNLVNADGTLKGGRDIAAVIAQTKTDMTSLLDNVSARDGIPDNLTFEIGSEYYETTLWDYFAEEFTGDTQQALTNVARALGFVYAAQVEAIAAYEEAHGVEINAAVQIGKSSSGLSDDDVGRGGVNGLFIAAFKNAQFIASDTINAVDSLIFHRYAPSHQGILGGGKQLDTEGADVTQGVADWQAAGAGNGTVDLVGGWLAPAAQNDTFDSRLHLSPMLDLYSRFVAVGMDIGTVFATNQSNAGTLGHRDGSGEYRAYMGGQLYEMMLDQVPGTRLHDGYQSNVPLTTLGQDQFVTGTKDHLIPLSDGTTVNQYIFSNEYKVVTYLAAGNLVNGGMVQTVSYGDESFALVEETHLYATDQDVVDSYQSYINGGNNLTRMNGVIGTQDTQSHEAISTLPVHFAHDYELVELVSIRKEAVSEHTYDLTQVDPRYQRYVTDLTLTGSDAVDGFGNQHDNQITGNAANNELWGRGGDDTLNGGDGDDILHGGDGADVMIGGAGIDVADYSDASHVFVRLDAAQWSAWDAAGDSFSGVENVAGSDYADRIFGDQQHNTFWGNGGNDVLLGYGGDDTLYGGAGHDWLIGGDGQDTLNGGADNDVIFGELGSDVFVFADDFGKDTIRDFELDTPGEVIDLSGVSSITSFYDLQANHLTEWRSHALILDGTGNQILLVNIDKDDLGADDFIF